MINVQRLKSKKYLDWVKTQPCVITGVYGVDAHHISAVGLGGMGLKPSDYLAFPLCREYHDELHRHGAQTWEENHGPQWAYVAQTLHRAIEQGVL